MYNVHCTRERLRRVVLTVVGPVDAWIARTHDIITHRGGTSVCSTLPIHAYAGRCIGFLRITSQRRLPYKAHGLDAQRWTQWDSNPRHPPCKGGTLPLSYEPNSVGSADQARIVSLGSSKVPDCTKGPGGIALAKPTSDRNEYER